MGGEIVTYTEDQETHFSLEARAKRGADLSLLTQMIQCRPENVNRPNRCQHNDRNDQGIFGDVLAGIKSPQTE